MIRNDLTADYDKSADVLYLTVGHHMPDRYEEDAEGLVWRYDAEGRPYGVTIMDFNEYWRPRKEHLTSRIIELLHLSRTDVLRALQ